MAEENEKQEPLFTLQKIYVKDASFESPMSPGIFTKPAEPSVDVQMQISHTVLDPQKGFYEGVLTVTVTATFEEQTGFLAEVHQAGVFQISGVPETELEMVLEIACPNVLLPFAREAVNDLVGKGGFPQLLLSPVNFEALYHQKQSRKQGEAKPGKDTAEKKK